MDFENIDIHNSEDKHRIFDLIEQHLMKSDFLALKKVSNDLIDLAIIKTDKNIVYLSYIPYVLYKLLTQPHIVKVKSWEENKKIILEGIDKIEKRDSSEYVSSVIEFKKLFLDKDMEMYRYIKNMIEKAKVKQASRMYSAGFNVKKAINLSDADLIEFNHYLHHNKEHETIEFQEEISHKIELLKDIVR